MSPLHYLGAEPLGPPEPEVAVLGDVVPDRGVRKHLPGAPDAIRGRVEQATRRVLGHTGGDEPPVVVGGEEGVTVHQTSVITFGDQGQEAVVGTTQILLGAVRASVVDHRRNFAKNSVRLCRETSQQDSQTFPLKTIWVPFSSGLHPANSMGHSARQPQRRHRTGGPTSRTGSRVITTTRGTGLALACFRGLCRECRVKHDTLD